MLLLIFAIIAIITSLFFSKRSQNGPAMLGKIVYDDAGRSRPETVLVSHRYRLAGKPDYIVKNANGSFPVEVKSRVCRDRGPYDSEKAQLYAYCLLVEELTEQPVTFGLIEYTNRQWRVVFGEKERHYILGLLDEIRQVSNAPDTPRNHSEVFRCRQCGFRGNEICGQALC